MERRLTTIATGSSSNFSSSSSSRNTNGMTSSSNMTGSKTDITADVNRNTFDSYQQKLQNQRRQICCYCLKSFHHIVITLFVLCLISTSILFLVWTTTTKTTTEYTASRNNNNNGFNTFSTSSSKNICNEYNGILHIAQGDVEGAAGTIFFLFVLNQINYAEKYQLLPWVHLSNTSYHVYDPYIHNNNNVRTNRISTMDMDYHHGDRTTINSSMTTTTTTFPIWSGVTVSWSKYIDPISQQMLPYPGPPIQTKSMLTQQSITITGTGVWNSYFEPVSDFTPNDFYDNSKKNKRLQSLSSSSSSSSSSSCYHKLPYIRFSHEQIIPALHVYCPWSLRAWRYGGLPPGLSQQHQYQNYIRDKNDRISTTSSITNNTRRHQSSSISYHDWFQPMRQRGNALVIKYVHIRPYIQKLADKANPIITNRDDNNQSNLKKQCLAMHIRHSDKGNRRKRIPVRNFLPYVKAYYDIIIMEHKNKKDDENYSNSNFTTKTINNGNSSSTFYPLIYLATDSYQVIKEIQTTWPNEIIQYISWQKDDDDGNYNIIRSNDTTPVFSNKLTKSHQHITNVQVLVDIIAMSKCHYILHGHSAVSEATHYFNYPQLHTHSVNLEYPRKIRPTVQDFIKLLQK